MSRCHGDYLWTAIVASITSAAWHCRGQRTGCDLPAVTLSAGNKNTIRINTNGPKTLELNSLHDAMLPPDQLFLDFLRLFVPCLPSKSICVNNVERS